MGAPYFHRDEPRRRESEQKTTLDENFLVPAQPSRSANPNASRNSLDRDHGAPWDDVVESIHKEVIERVDFDMNK